MSSLDFRKKNGMREFWQRLLDPFQFAKFYLKKYFLLARREFTKPNQKIYYFIQYKQNMSFGEFNPGINIYIVRMRT